MKDIRIYDFEFNLLCIMTDVISSQWHILYNGVGTYEGHFRMEDEISNIILSNKYIVITQGDLQAICTGRIVNDELIVCGRTVNWILTKRVRPPFRAREIFGESYTDPETVLLYCLKKGFIEPPKINSDGLEDDDTIDENKAVSNFIIPEPTGAEAFTYHFWRSSAHDLSELTIELCKKLNRGHRVIFDIDNKCWRFEFIYPKENDMLLSKDAKNVYDITYTEDIQNEASGGWYPATLDDSDGADNTWCYILSEEKKGIYAWDSVLNYSGQSAATDALQKLKVTDSTKGKLRNLEYIKDYNLGDIVSVFVKFGQFERLSPCIINGVDIQITRDYSFQEPDLANL